MAQEVTVTRRSKATFAVTIPNRMTRAVSRAAAAQFIVALALTQTATVFSCARQTATVGIVKPTPLVVQNVTMALVDGISITVNYISLSDCKCEIKAWPRNLVAPFMADVVCMTDFYLNATEHPSPHSHVLDIDGWGAGPWILQIICTNDLGETVLMPGVGLHYFLNPIESNPPFGYEYILGEPDGHYVWPITW